MEEHPVLTRPKILIADDSEINRALLADMLGDGYDILEAASGAEAIGLLEKQSEDVALLLLDVVMPELDGFGVLAMMGQYRWIDRIPVIMISAEPSPAYVERAFELGAADYINRPFDPPVVRRRVANALMLYGRLKQLLWMVRDQMDQREKSSDLMVSILSHIVEFRNGESGLHVVHIRTLTELLLRQMAQTGRCALTEEDIALIGTASALHDVGKIAIPGEILNKPGRLTEEEYAVMKTHALVGADLLRALPAYGDEPLIRTAYEICRWHHERYDGGGYPDGLRGEGIPLSARAVALADVYDALTSRRVYKPAYPHAQALQMILDGACGAFDPLLLDCLTELAGRIPRALEDGSGRPGRTVEALRVPPLLLCREKLAVSARTLRLLEEERDKYRFFAAAARELQFEYAAEPPVLTLSPRSAERLALAEAVLDPLRDPRLLARMDRGALEALGRALRQTTPEAPDLQWDGALRIDGTPRRFRFLCRARWDGGPPPRYRGAFGLAWPLDPAGDR